MPPARPSTTQDPPAPKAAIRLPTEHKQLPTRLRDDEVHQRAEQLARLIEERRREEGLQKEAKDAMKARLQGYENLISETAEVVNRREELRTIEVVVEYLPSEDQVRRTRTDDGQIISVDKPTAAERQTAMDLAKP